MEAGIIVCYYTPGPYAAECHRLVRSIVRLGLPHFVEQMPPVKTWLEGVHLRPQFLRGCRELFPDRVLLSVDADAVVHSNPWPLLPSGPWDVAIHHLARNKRLEALPGTLALWPGSGADKLLNVWQRVSKRLCARPNRYAYAAAVKQSGVKVADLPPELCWIFDLSMQTYGRRQPVIEHLQASRSYKVKTHHSIRDKSRRDRLKQLEAVL